MELKHLRYFLVTATEKNISRSAKLLHTSQPSVSRIIQEAENEIGTPLFIRTANGVEVTLAGERLFKHASHVVSIMDKGLIDIRRSVEPLQKIKLGFIASTLLFDLLELLRSRQYDVSILECHESNFHNQVQSVLNNTIDIGIIGTEDDTQIDGLCIEKFKTLKLFAVMASTHRLSGRKSVCLNDLQNEKFIALSDPFFKNFTRTDYNITTQAGFTPEIAYEASGLISALATVSTGACIGLLPRGILPSTTPGFIYVPLQGEELYIHASCIYRKGDSRKAITDLISIVKRNYTSTPL